MKNKQRLINAAKWFYLGIDEIDEVMTDKEYDKLLLESGMSKSDVLKEIGIEVNPNYHQSVLPKEQFEDHKWMNWTMRDPHYVWTPKFDGTSITIRYVNGRLFDILSADSGISQYDKFKDFVPREVNPRISEVYCEAVIHLKHGFGDRSRSKANGLVNSKYLQHEVDEYMTLIAFRIETEDNDNYFLLMNQLPTIPDKFILTPTKFKISENKNILNDEYLIDGVVRYDQNGQNGLIYKIYFNEVVPSVVESIILQYTDKDAYSTKVKIETTRIEGSNINYVTTGGASRMFDLGIGVGSKVQVIKSGATIPIIKQVLEPTEGDIELYCECGTQLTRQDVVGLNLKCSNDECSKRNELFYNRLSYYAENFKDLVDKYHENPTHPFIHLSIDRWNPSRRLGTVEDLDWNKLSELSMTDFKYRLRSYCHFTATQERIFNTSVIGLYNAIQKLKTNE